MAASPELFVQLVQEVLARLHDDRSGRADLLRKEAEQLLQAFRGWEGTIPATPVRVVAITRLFELQRQALQYIVNKSSY